MSAATIRARYGSIWPAIEYELDPVTHQRTGRTRRRQYVSYPRPHDPKPMIPWEFS